MEKRVEALDSLRGFMAVHVALRHLAGYSSISFHPVIATILAPFLFGPPGHALFFVLSGFGLARSMMGKARAGVSPSLAEYVTARWRRIAPPYYVAIILCLAIPSVVLTNGRLSIRTPFPDLYQVVTHALFLHGFGTSTMFGISHPLWSLSLIFQFYLIFPLLHVAMERMDYRSVVAAVLILWLAIRVFLKLVAMNQGFSTDVFWCYIPYRLPTFTLGMAVAYWYGTPRHSRADGPAPFMLGLIAALCLGGSVASDRWGHESMTEMLLGVGYSALLMAALTTCEREGSVGRFLRRPLFVWLGAISYSLYLTHDLVFSRICIAYRYFVPDPNLIGDASLVAASLVLSLSVARAFHQLVERRVRPRRRT